MKKLIALVLIFICLLCVMGCNESIREVYKLPHDRIYYLLDQPHELNDDDMQYIIDILNSANWIDDMSNCYSEVSFFTREQEMRYSISCGVFSDYTNKRFVVVTEEQQDILNAIFSTDR